MKECTPEVREVLTQVLGESSQQSEAPQPTIYDPVTMPPLPEEQLQGKILVLVTGLGW